MSYVTRPRATKALCVAAVIGSLAACGGGTVQLRDIQPRRSPPDTILTMGHIASAEVRIAPSVGDVQTTELQTNELPAQIERLLLGLGSGATPYALVVTITQLDHDSGGRDAMSSSLLTTQTVVTDPSGAVVRSFHHNAIAAAGRHNGRLRSICEKTVRFVGESL